MKLNKIFTTTTLVIFMGIFTMSPVLAGAPGTDKEAPPRVFSGTVEINSTQMAFIISGQTGGGILEFEGKEYEFTIGGLGVGGVGIQKINAIGVVYNLDRVEDFEGIWTQARYGVAIGKGSGGIGLNNGNVIMELKSSLSGVMLSLGLDGMSVKFK